jgi:Zn-finger nucleic acid-binding protein
MFQGTVFCPKCGARSSRAAPEPSTKGCPGCRGHLAQVLLGDVPLLECAACDGVWVAAADFERICASREAQAAVLERHRSTPPSTARRAPIHYRPCVVCGKMMNRVNFGRVSGTVIDVCRGHGTFLDAGELHAIATFIMEGGLDLARQREKEDLEAERHRLTLLKAQIESRSHDTSWEHRSALGDSLLEIRRMLKEE